MSIEQSRGAEPPVRSSGSAPIGDAGMQILSTEHWSLLATRSLTYSEVFSRGAMFISVLSGAMIAIALVAQADHFGRTFVTITILILVVVIFVGFATVGRIGAVNGDDMHWVMGMNRIRNAYLELHPELEKYFITSRYDDWPGIAKTMNMESVPQRGLGGLLHGLQTLTGTLSVIVSIVAAALGGLIALDFGAPPELSVSTGIAAFILVMVLLGAWGFTSISAFWKALAPKFPQPR